MAYTSPDFPSKAALKRAVAAGAKISVYSAGPFGGPYAGRSSVGLEGPHYPKPHSWYATASVDASGFVASVK